MPLKDARGLGVKKLYMATLLLKPSWRCRMLNFVESRIENGHSDHVEDPFLREGVDRHSKAA